VVAISFPQEPILLCQRDILADVVVDSWDHPVRRTAGFKTRIAVGWNSAIAEEWRAVQGAADITVGPPVKLRYAYESAPLQPTTSATKTLLLPVCTSTAVPPWFSDEVQAIGAIFQAAQHAGWKVILKPKPNTRPDELADLLSKFPAVELASFSLSDGPLDYRLTGAYNEQRLRELERCSVVLNSVTTFGLDAACAGVPLLQLDLRAMSDLRFLASAARNRHLIRHLYPIASDAVLRPRTLAELQRQLEEFLLRPPWAAMAAASSALAKYVAPSHGAGPAASAMLNLPQGAPRRNRRGSGLAGWLR
jgi:hypothetical protein